MGWNGTVLGRLMFGWESPESEDVPLGNIRMRFGFTPSPQISRTGAVPSGTRRSLAGVEEERRRCAEEGQGPTAASLRRRRRCAGELRPRGRAGELRPRRC